MSFIGRLFGTAKAVDDFTDKDNGHLAKFGGWIGNMNYTDQEKAGDDMITRRLAIEYLGALAPFKVMQRIMVTIIMAEWAILFNVLIVAICLQANTVVKDLLAFAQTPFAWAPVSGAVTLYLLGGVPMRPHLPKPK